MNAYDTDKLEHAHQIEGSLCGTYYGYTNGPFVRFHESHGSVAGSQMLSAHDSQIDEITTAYMLQTKYRSIDILSDR